MVPEGAPVPGAVHHLRAAGVEPPSLVVAIPRRRPRRHRARGDVDYGQRHRHRAPLGILHERGQHPALSPSPRAGHGAHRHGRGLCGDLHAPVHGQLEGRPPWPQGRHARGRRQRHHHGLCAALVVLCHVPAGVHPLPAHRRGAGRQRRRGQCAQPRGGPSRAQALWRDAHAAQPPLQGARRRDGLCRGALEERMCACASGTLVYHFLP